MFENWLAARLAPLHGLSDLIFRIGTSLIFIIGGLGHFLQADDMLARIDESPWAALASSIADPLLLLHLSGAVFIAAGLALAVGYSTRLAALALFVTLVPITFVIHMAPGHTGPLFKNVAILAALAFVFVRGADCCAVDTMLRRRALSPA
ncbi:MAG: DoxX family protein [Acidobacteria bacterium]|nr:DoxX family protein [Acidobacteriota bacterium]